jgi:hypothetical protein
MASCSSASLVISRITDSVSLAAVADARASGCTLEMRSSGTLAKVSPDLRCGEIGLASVAKGGHGPPDLGCKGGVKPPAIQPSGRRRTLVAC